MTDDIAKSYAGPAAVAIQGNEPWDSARLVTRDGNRWSHPGEPTIYLAGDVPIALAEFARHLPVETRDRDGSLWTVVVELDTVVDLRHGEASGALSIPTGADWPLDQETCRQLAGDLRARGVQGLLVPSVAFLDRPDRGNLVLFADRIGARLDEVIREPRRWGSIQPVQAGE